MTVSQNAARPRQPDWRHLLSAGLAVLANGRPFLWYFAVSMAPSLVYGLFQPGDTAMLVLAAATLCLWIFVQLLLTRQIIVGRLVFIPYDRVSFWRILGVLLLAFPLALIVSLPVIVAGLDEALSTLLTMAAIMGTGIYLTVRLCLYVPALALVDDTSLMRAFAQSRPYWRPISVVLVLTALPASLIARLLGGLEMPRAIGAILAAGAGAAADLVFTGAVCFLYLNYVRARP